MPSLPTRCLSTASSMTAANPSVSPDRTTLFRLIQADAVSYLTALPAASVDVCLSIFGAFSFLSRH
jgi:hypothetical protein